MTITTEKPTRRRAAGAALRRLRKQHLNALWTQLDSLMPTTPSPRAVPFVWKWSTLYPLAQRAGDLVPVGRGGERRAIALANPGLGRLPYVTPTLWAAIQYLGPKKPRPNIGTARTPSASSSRVRVSGLSSTEIRLVRRGDFLLTPGWNFHGHHNETDQPMAWIDGLDIPFVHYTDTGFFEFGSEGVTDESTPGVSRSERLWAHPGLRPLVGLDAKINSPIAAYRWEYTDAALREQLALEDEGFAATTEPGHAAVRYTNPTTGGDVMPTIRAEFHRFREGTHPAPAAMSDRASTKYSTAAGCSGWARRHTPSARAT